MQIHIYTVNKAKILFYDQLTEILNNCREVFTKFNFILKLNTLNLK